MSEMRDPLGRVRGLGSARRGVEHWWAQRLTAAALVPLSLWFVGAIIGLAGADYQHVASWAGNLWNASLLLLLIGATLYHMALGLQVVVEDYLSEGIGRLVTLVALKAITLALGAVAVLSIARLVVGRFA